MKEKGNQKQQHNTTPMESDRQVDRHTVVVHAGEGISWWYRETKSSGIDQSINPLEEIEGQGRREQETEYKAASICQPSDIAMLNSAIGQSGRILAGPALVDAGTGVFGTNAVR